MTENPTLDQFPAEQRYYLDLLCKYSNRPKNLSVASPQDMPSKKLAYIQENFNHITVDQQLAFNNYNKNFKNQIKYSILLGVATTFGLLAFYIVKSPLTKTLYFEFGKSALMGGVLGYGYYRVQNYIYIEKIHQIYVVALAKSQYKL